ncbi:hypothetical protein KRX19_08895 [Cardiobacteriaceae bacterium TAE3-ERU3]|nr:hypothetical protein [Cardiobacteriaceae bacterium TAE3-ERU3]
MKQKHLILASTLLLLAACAGNNSDTRLSSKQLALPKANLPITADKWTIWHCADGNTLRTRYSTANGSELILETSTMGSHHLLREPGSNPAIYSNAAIGFYSDGKFAAIGRPLSDEIYSGGCIVR